MTQILLLGTVHYEQCSLDIFSKQVQDEIQYMTEKIARFNPDAIAVEWAKTKQASIDATYLQYLKGTDDLEGRHQCSSERELQLENGHLTIGDGHEVVQLGYRLGKMLNLERVYATDVPIDLDDFAWDNRTEQVQAKWQKYYDKIQSFGDDSLLEICRRWNTSKSICTLDQDVYLGLNRINHGNYEGAMLLTRWYERNLKIFSNIQALAQHHKRIFVQYGAGHLKILRDLIDGSSELELVDISDYL